MSISVFPRLAVCIAVCFSVTADAFEFRSVGRSSTVQVNRVDTSAPYEILDEIAAPSFIRGYIGFNEQVGSLYFKVAAKKRSKIRIEYDNEDLLYSQLSGSDEIAINAAGRSVSISFNVFSPVSGHIKIFNEKNKLLKIVAYSVLKERRYRQSLNGNISNSKSARGDEANSASLNYSLSKKTINSNDPFWNLNTSISADFDNIDDRTVNVGLSYSW